MTTADNLHGAFSHAVHPDAAAIISAALTHVPFDGWGEASLVAGAVDAGFTADYHDPDKRSIANALTVELADGTVLPEVAVEYPIGHRRRREDGIPLLVEKFRTNLARRFPPKQQQAILDVSLDQAALEAMPVHEYVDLYVI